MDAVGSDALGLLAQKPFMYEFLRGAVLSVGLSSVFVTNTYPVHTSVATGELPEKHGIRSNMTFSVDGSAPKWITDCHNIKVKPLWVRAALMDKDVAAVMWPVTANAEFIKYNIPEVMAEPGKSQLMTSLRAGSVLTQIVAYIKYRKYLSEILQPGLDCFAAAAMSDIIRRKHPDLMMIHFTAYDSACHEHGVGSPEALAALDILDDNFGMLRRAISKNTHVIVFSDHSQINTHTTINPNKLLWQAGIVKTCDTHVECCGGTAYFHGGCRLNTIKEAQELLSVSEGFGRYLTKAELKASGYDNVLFGFAARPGYEYGDESKPHRANHGYPADYDNYGVFAAIAEAPESSKGIRIKSLLDICGIVEELLQR